MSRPSEEDMVYRPINECKACGQAFRGAGRICPGCEDRMIDQARFTNNYYTARGLGRPANVRKDETTPFDKEPPMSLRLKCPACSVVFYGLPGLTPQPCPGCQGPVSLQDNQAPFPAPGTTTGRSMSTTPNQANVGKERPEEPEEESVGPILGPDAKARASMLEAVHKRNEQAAKAEIFGDVEVDTVRDALGRLGAVEIHNLAVDLADHLLEALPNMEETTTYGRLAVALAEALSTYASGEPAGKVSEQAPLLPQDVVNVNVDIDLIDQAVVGKRGVDQQRIAKMGLDFVATILRKNHDYGSSVFEPPVLVPDLDPGVSILVRASDKIRRLETLRGKEPEVVGEAVHDTVKDLGAYCLLYLCRPVETSTGNPWNKGKRSKVLSDMLETTKDHHPACGCGVCCAVSGWSEQDEANALNKENQS